MAVLVVLPTCYFNCIVSASSLSPQILYFGAYRKIFLFSFPRIERCVATNISTILIRRNPATESDSSDPVTTSVYRKGQSVAAVFIRPPPSRIIVISVNYIGLDDSRPNKVRSEIRNY